MCAHLRLCSFVWSGSGVCVYVHYQGGSGALGRCGTRHHIMHVAEHGTAPHTHCSITHGRYNILPHGRPVCHSQTQVDPIERAARALM